MAILKSLAIAVCFFGGALAAKAESPLLFPPDQFGAVDLVPTQSSAGDSRLLETLGALVDRFEPINGLSDTNKYRKLGRAIGRLKILVAMPNGERGVASCTATLIAPDRLITNYHCVPGVRGERIEQVAVDFFYLDHGTSAMRAFEVDPAPVEADKSLDFAILKVRGDPTREADLTPVAFEPRRIQNNESLFLIHHPAGQPQRLTRAFCRAHPTKALDAAEIRHLCDTMPGSSGALVFADDDFALVGIHHRGGLAPGDMSSFNRGTDIGALTKLSPVLAALTSARPPPSAVPRAPTTVQPAVGVFEPAYKPGETFRDCADCPEMVVVPAGSFTMGPPEAEEGKHKIEGPQVKVTIAEAFAVGKYEVTFAEWDACAADGGCPRADDHGLGRGKRPVINISWQAITKQFLPWLSQRTGKTYRLLSEAEWEYAARAGTTTPFSTGATIMTHQANFDGTQPYGGSAAGMFRQGTVDVGSFQPNAFGLHDMHGNVWEWVEDCYHGGYQGAPADGSAWTTACHDQSRMLRGGSWSSGPLNVRSAARAVSFGNRPDKSNGFRLARTLQPAP
jgi:formylglycine-generating enzyme required for sulfatase activity/V8-like Glu-specific endopeptidase